MSEVPLHRQYLHYSELPASLRVLYTAVLVVMGLAYAFAGLYLYHTYAGRAGGNPMLLTYQDVVVAYRGSGQGSRLEAALRGPMRNMLPADEVQPILKWVQEGVDRVKLEQQVKPILEKRCYSCHDGSNPHLANLSDFDTLKKAAERDTGTDIFTLVRVSHIHLFGLTMVFFILGVIFSHAYVRPVWLKCAVIVLPFVSLTLDIGSWYITKIFAPFAGVVILGGALMAFSFGFMWVVSFYQLWFSPPPVPVAQRGQVSEKVIA